MAIHSTNDQIPSPDRETRRAPNSLYGTPSKYPRETESPRSSSCGARLVCKEQHYPGQKRSYEHSLDPVQGHRSQKKRKLSGRGNLADEETPQLACPFSKLDGGRYYECLKFKLHRVRDVKQHIARRHRGPEFYCARCWQTFPDRSKQDEHMRTVVCATKPKPLFEGISDSQRNQLARSADRGATPEQQWYSIWEILFPGKQKPSSIYLGNFMEETLSHIGKRCQNADWGTLLKALGKRRRNRVDEELVKDIVMVALDWFPTIINTEPAEYELGMVEAEESSTPGQVSPNVSTPGLTSSHSVFNIDLPLPDLQSSSDICDLKDLGWVSLEDSFFDWDKEFPA